jgi:hypothetical protein
MTQQESITVYSIPSGMGGVHTVSIVEDMGEQVKVRIWYGRPSPTGWESWGEWDGQTRIVDRASLTGERTQKLVRLPEDTSAGWIFCQPYEAENYNPENVVAKYIHAFHEGELYRMYEIDENSQSIKEYRVDPSELSEAHKEQAKAVRHECTGYQVKVWERGQTAAA